MTRNSRSIARNFNAAMEQTGRAIRPKSQSPWVYNLKMKCYFELGSFSLDFTLAFIFFHINLFTHIF